MQSEKLKLISVIIPTCKRPQLLRRAIESVLQQNYQNIELLVSSDGIDYESEQCVKSFQDSRIIYIESKTRKGASHARSRALDCASGYYIAFLDDDDHWLPEKLARQLEILEKIDSDYAFSYTWMNIFSSGKFLRADSPCLEGMVLDNLLECNFVGCPTVILTKKLADAIGGFDETLTRFNDYDYFLRAAKLSPFHVVKMPLCEVHIGEHDSISRDNPRQIKSLIKAYEKWTCEYSDVLNLNIKLKDNFYYKLFRLYTLSLNPWKGLNYYFKISPSFQNPSSFPIFFKIFGWLSKGISLKTPKLR